MDQDSFRQLLQTSGGTPTATVARGSFLGTKAGSSKPKAAASAAPSFKPRKVKKKDDSYRDRAEERRLGKESDYAQVEAVLEDFERRNADAEDKQALEEQRKYLGGDSEHSILVKGLDFALLEQNRARLASVSSKQDDELLEQAFAEVASAPDPGDTSTSKKRSRADIIKALKEKRGAGDAPGAGADATAPAEKPPPPDRFKPIGFKPIGAGHDSKKKKAKRKEGKEGEEGDRKKKKRKVDTVPDASAVPLSLPSSASATAGPSTARKAPTPEPEPETLEEDFDIFAGAGDYEGIVVNSDDDDDDAPPPRRPQSPSRSPSPRAAPPQRRGWFDNDEEAAPPPPPPALDTKAPSAEPITRADEGEVDEEGQVRLAPLASSAIPSIKDLLAVNEAVEKEEKRKARKEKKKGGRRE